MPDEPADIAKEAGIPVIPSAVSEARKIVKDAAGLQSFLDSYEPGDNPSSHVLAWDSRVMVIGHSNNRAACIAISSAMQTAAAIARSLSCASRVEMYRSTKDQPIYDIVFITGKRTRNIIAGLLASLAGVARSARGLPVKKAESDADEPVECTDVVVFSDHRTRIPNAPSTFEGDRAEQ